MGREGGGRAGPGTWVQLAASGCAAATWAHACASRPATALPPTWSFTLPQKELITSLTSPWPVAIEYTNTPEWEPAKCEMAGTAHGTPPPSSRYQGRDRHARTARNSPSSSSTARLMEPRPPTVQHESPMPCHITSGRLCFFLPSYFWL